MHEGTNSAPEFFSYKVIALLACTLFAASLAVFLPWSGLFAASAQPLGPYWLLVLSVVSLAVACLCATIIVSDEIQRPQHMGITSVVWPVSALFGSVVVLWAYYRYGLLATHRAVARAKARGEDPLNKTQTPFAVMVGKRASHCGSGCTLGDICAEWLAFLVPVVAVWFGWRWAFHEKM